MTDIKDLDEILGTPDYISKILKNTMNLVQISNETPEKEELQFLKGIPSCSQNLKASNNTLINQMKDINEFISSQNKLVVVGKTVKYNDIVDAIDILLENIDVTLDKIKNIQANTLQKQQEQQQQPSTLIAKKDKNLIEKPQLKYGYDFNNDMNMPFLPKIQEKPNAKVPIPDVIIQAQQDFEVFLKKIPNAGEFEFPHPYEHELTTLEYPEHTINIDIKTQNPQPMKSEYLMFVDNYQAFTQVVEELSQENIIEIAIDLEHHDYRSYQGITCLMQLSTRFKDYIIDVLLLRQHMHELNKIFTNPNVVKVLHGADSDILWLQKDFNCYILNMFDTGQAARILQFPSCGLAYLLNKYCNVHADKKYQLADWRERPLTREMIHYAREDTHYLLYIYDEIRKELISKALERQNSPTTYLNSVLAKSKDLCLQVYQKPRLKNEAYYNLLARNKPIMSTKKYELLKSLLKWRDSIARLEDESLRYILPNNIMFQIVDSMPKTTLDLFSLTKNTSYIIKKYAQDIVKLVKEILESNINPEKKFNDTEVKPTDEAVTNTKSEAITKQNNEDYEKAMTQLMEMKNPDAEVMTQSKPFTFKRYNTGFKINNNTIEEGNNLSVYQSLFEANSSENTQAKKNENQVESIKHSFCYNSCLDFLMEIRPKFKEDVITAQLEKQKQNQVQNMIIEENKQLKQAKITDNKEGFVEFSEEPKQRPPEIKKEYSLGLVPPSNESKKDKNIFKPDATGLPVPIKDLKEYESNSKKRKRDKDKKNTEAEKFNDTVKKLKNNMAEAKQIEKMKNQYGEFSSGDEDNNTNQIKPQTNTLKGQVEQMKDMWNKLSDPSLFQIDPLQTLTKDKKQINDKKRKNSNPNPKTNIPVKKVKRN